jgi:hypothetical protein
MRTTNWRIHLSLAQSPSRSGSPNAVARADRGGARADHRQARQRDPRRWTRRSASRLSRPDLAKPGRACRSGYTSWWHGSPSVWRSCPVLAQEMDQACNLQSPVLRDRHRAASMCRQSANFSLIISKP